MNFIPNEIYHVYNRGNNKQLIFFNDNNYIFSCYSSKDWKYSSFPDYYGYRSGTLCNRDITMKLLSLTENDFKNEERLSLNEKIISQLF